MNTTTTAMETMQIVGLVMTLNAIPNSRNYHLSINDKGLSVSSFRDSELVEQWAAFNSDQDFEGSLRQIKESLQGIVMRVEQVGEEQEQSK